MQQQPKRLKPIFPHAHHTQGYFLLSQYSNARLIAFVNYAVVSLKPGHMDWVRDFDFMLNLFSLPSP